MKYQTRLIAIAFFFLLGTLSRAEINIVSDRNEIATATFRFRNVASPSKTDAATHAKFMIVEGEQDGAAGGLEKLHDGAVPTEEDQPAENFFFNAGTSGGRLVIDLGGKIDIRQINTYSWHPGARGPQVFQLYASDGTGDFNLQPSKGIDPAKCGWRQVAKVDTRPSEGAGGGQYGVSISDSSGTIGSYRYLLFDVARTEETDRFGNTFYSEIDVVDRNAPETVSEIATSETIEKTFETDGGRYQITLDTTAAPDLTEWAQKVLAKVAQEWYPKIVGMLPGEGFEAPRHVNVTFRDGMRGTPAATSGSRIGCNIDWFRRNLKGEAAGAVVHEMVHVVQQYGRARRNNPNATRAPGWLVEGIPDYIRWFLYEPESKGAEITRRNLSRARYDGNYRITGNFLNWVTGKYDKEIVPKLNSAAREGKYNEDLWKEYTGKSLPDLGDEWKKAMEEKVAAQEPAVKEGQ